MRSACRCSAMTFDFRENETRMSEWVTQKAGDICQAMGADIMGPVDGPSGSV